MVTVVFWNLAKNAATLPHLACLAAGHGVDALFLAECPKDLSSAMGRAGAALARVGE